MPFINGKEVGPTGYGTMRMTWTAEPTPDTAAFETLNKALELGANFWNGGELYGTPEYNSLHLMNKYFTKYPENAEKIVLSIKGGLQVGSLTPDGSEENIRRSVDTCLKLVGAKKIDIFECARQDPNFPIEHTVQVLANYVKEGKIGGIGLSEVDAETIRRAAKIHPIAAVEVEVSMWSPDIFENDIAKTCAELNIPVVAYSPLGRGALTGALTSVSDIPEGDFRHHLARFKEENFQQNMKLINEVKSLAGRKGVAPAQVALGWIRSLSDKPGMPTIIPIPGGTTVDKVTQNLSGVKLFSVEEMAEVDAILKQHTVAGGRYV
ncbi:hypothetical protein N7478_005245 [Penicillium angulare]|uniref:uncharacterized protein n=1 Tax=Penicillium angulare TaxID=116970 RepID=UPI0025412EC6|nr:uncharacterized protein N7478_005245 [Penicillium angulare]KAJ5279873.1 hypothetical protein N7478_005245 [Penicillium angulare]